MLKKILGALGVFILVFCAAAAMQPDEFRVERSATMAASADEIFAHINSHREWQAWSPWAKMDPNASFTYEGPESGVGAVGAWAGNMDVGEGTSTITESRPNDFVQFKLEFKEPMEGTNFSEFTLEPAGAGQTRVTWNMYGPQNFFGKVMGLLMNCEKMVGEQFDSGLANLKQIVEK